MAAWSVVFRIPSAPLRPPASAASKMVHRCPCSGLSSVGAGLREPRHLERVQAGGPGERRLQEAGAKSSASASAGRGPRGSRFVEQTTPQGVDEGILPGAWKRS